MYMRKLHSPCCFIRRKRAEARVVVQLHHKRPKQRDDHQTVLSSSTGIFVPGPPCSSCPTGIAFANGFLSSAQRKTSSTAVSNLKEASAASRSMGQQSDEKRLEEIICCNFRVNRIQVQPGRRNDSAIIRAFLKAITFATLLNGGVVYALVTYSSVHSFNYHTPHPEDTVGLRWPDSMLSCVQTPLLFLGTLYWSHSRGGSPASPNILSSGLLSNLWDGPLMEESVFRACVLYVYALANAVRWKMIAFAPLVFGLGHFHHASETYKRDPDASRSPRDQRTVPQRPESLEAVGGQRESDRPGLGARVGVAGGDLTVRSPRWPRMSGVCLSEWSADTFLPEFSRSSQPRHNPDRPRAPTRHRAGDYDPSGQLARCPNVLSLTSSLCVWYCYLAKIGDRAEAAEMKNLYRIDLGIKGELLLSDDLPPQTAQLVATSKQWILAVEQIGHGETGI
ncbi:hypothetical protein B0H14DRAFT_3543903 [Mycena olivaceomarginata]|nr:hypothetical protein B0H14DRAFT_3543903 [Mycena olivaceomarginata]